MPAETQATEAEARAFYAQMQQALLETFALVHRANAKIAMLEAENAMLSAALALLEKGRAA